MSREPVADISRRRLLAASGGALVGVAALETAAPRALAMKPVERGGQTPLRLSLAGYSLRKYLELAPGTPGACDLLRFAELAAEWGFDAVEPTSYYFPREGVDEFVYELKRKCLRLGLDVSGGAIGDNFTFGPGDELEREFAAVQQWVDRYAELGAPVVRVFAGKPPEGMTEETAIANATRNLEQACASAGKRGVTLALENHDFLMDADRILQIVRRIESPWFGVNWDSGNFPTTDPWGDLAKLAPYAVNAQVKVEMVLPGTGRSPADLPRVIEILREANYRGYVVLEYEAAEDPLVAIPRYAKLLRALL